MSNNQTKCFGVEGADTKILNCTVDTKKKEITILNAFQYQLTNPGKISLKFESFVNPKQNIVTDSFHLSTYNSNGYLMDRSN